MRYPNGPNGKAAKASHHIRTEEELLGRTTIGT